MPAKINASFEFLDNLFGMFIIFQNSADNFEHKTCAISVWRAVSTKNIHILAKLNEILIWSFGVKLVPIKTLQSLNAKFRAINESFKTNLDCIIITMD